MAAEQQKRIERVEIFGFNDGILFFKFFEDRGKEVIGLVRGHRVFYQGEKLAPSK